MSFIYYAVAASVVVFSFAAQAPTKKQKAQIELAQENGKTFEIQPNWILVTLLAAILIFVAGVRYNVGADYGAYYKNYDGSLKALWQATKGYEEPGIYLIATIARLFYDNGIAVVFLAAAVTISCYIIAIRKYSPVFALSMILYLFVGAWHGCFNGVRQYLAAALLILGHRYILERKFWRYLLTVFCASLFHISVWVMILPYFFLTRKTDFKLLLLMALGSVVLLLSYDAIFDFIGFYKGQEVVMNEYATSGVNFLRILVAYAPLVFYWLFCQKKDLSREESFYINGIMMNAFGLLIAMNSTYLARISIYTEIYPIIGYGFLLRRIRDKRLSNIVLGIIILLYAVYWWYEISHSSTLSTFRWIWNK